VRVIIQTRPYVSVLLDCCDWHSLSSFWWHFLSVATVRKSCSWGTTETFRQRYLLPFYQEPSATYVPIAAINGMTELNCTVSSLFLRSSCPNWKRTGTNITYSNSRNGYGCMIHTRIHRGTLGIDSDPSWGQSCIDVGASPSSPALGRPHVCHVKYTVGVTVTEFPKIMATIDFPNTNTEGSVVTWCSLQLVHAYETVLST